MREKKLEGLIAAPFTPMDDNGNLNTGIINQYYQLLKANGVSGAFISGSTGEGVSLTHAEKKILAEAWAKATNHDKDFKVMFFLGGTSIEDCKDLASYAKQIGLFAVSFTAPFYFKPPSVDYLVDCCAEIAAVVPDMPFYYYHIPVLTGVNFSMYEFLKKADRKIPNLAGIKYTHEDFMDFMLCLNYKEEKYDMLWGRDENMLSALVLGAKGAVGSTFNYAPSLYHNMIEAFENNDLPKAREYQLTSIKMIRLLGKYGGIATGKSYMKLIGLDCGEFRLPVKNMNEEEFRNFEKDTESIGFRNFCAKSPDYIKTNS